MAKAKTITLTEEDADELWDVIFYAQRALKLDEGTEVEEMEQICEKWDEKFRKILQVPS